MRPFYSEEAWMSMIDGGALSSGRSSVPTIERASRVNAIRIGPD